MHVTPPPQPPSSSILAILTLIALSVADAATLRSLICLQGDSLPTRQKKTNELCATRYGRHIQLHAYASPLPDAEWAELHVWTSLLGPWHGHMRVTCTPISKASHRFQTYFRNHRMPLARTQTMAYAYSISLTTTYLANSNYPGTSGPQEIVRATPWCIVFEGAIVGLWERNSRFASSQWREIIRRLKLIIETLPLVYLPTVRTLQAYQLLR